MAYHTRTYTIWSGMKRRCLDPKNKRYKDYGGRGIDIDPKWVESFVGFIADMGQAPDGMSIERIDNEKGYWKWNCKWATRQEQYRNMRSNRFLSAQGKRMTLSDWARELGVHEASIIHRIGRKGMSVEDALTTPFVRREWKKSEALCLRCGHKWTTRVRRPKLCSKCGMDPHTKPHHTWAKEKLYGRNRQK